MKFPISAVISCLLAVTLADRLAAEPPNIVVIFIDDLGYGDIGPFGATRQKTPNLDRMAAEGRKFTSFYAAPVCSVSRAQLLTGCYGPRIGTTGVYFPAGPEGLNPAEVTIRAAQALWLRHRLHRQVAPGRPARVSAHPPGF